MSHAISFRLIAVLACCVVAACSSPPKPAEANGSSRIMINDPDRISQLQQQSQQERALSVENASLKNELSSMRSQMDEMRGLVRAALILPPPEPIAYAPAAQAPQPAALPAVASTTKPAAAPPPRPRVAASSAGQGGTKPNPLNSKP